MSFLQSCNDQKYSAEHPLFPERKEYQTIQYWIYFFFKGRFLDFCLWFTTPPPPFPFSFFFLATSSCLLLTFLQTLLVQEVSLKDSVFWIQFFFIRCFMLINWMSHRLDSPQSLYLQIVMKELLEDHELNP